MNKFAMAYRWFEKFVPGFFFVTIFLIMMLEIVSRGLFDKSFPWSTEYCRYVLVWVTFLGAVYVRHEGTHIQIMFVHEYLERSGHRRILFLINFLRSVIALAFWIFLVFYGYRLSVRTVRFLSSAMAISQYWLYIPTAICGIFAGAMEVVNLFRLFVPGDRPPVKIEANGVREGDR